MTFRKHVRVLNIALLALLAIALAGVHPAAARDGKTIRIGFQKYGTLTVTKVLGNLDKKFKADGIAVEWIEFPAGPQLLEGLNTGAIDFGTTGEAPPIFAQAASKELTYVAVEPGHPAHEAILIPEKSTIKSVAELKGKKVALNKGSNVHYFLIKALEEARLKYSDIEPVFLPPADARAAFTNGSVEAWVIWEPFLSVARKDLKAKTLRDGKDLVVNRQFYLARRSFVDSSADQLKTILDEIQKADAWAKDNRKEVAKLLAEQLGIDLGVIQAIVDSTTYQVDFLDPKTVEEQQKIADIFTTLELLPKPIVVKDAVWYGAPPATAQATVAATAVATPAK